jgi:transposase-like protein
VTEPDLEVAVVGRIEIAGQCCVVALIITIDGTKIPVGLWLDDTEKQTVATAPLADLVERGPSSDGGLLRVIDGAKALATAVKKVFGDQPIVQRCTSHKRGNLRGASARGAGAKIDWHPAWGFANPDPVKGLATVRGFGHTARFSNRQPRPTRLGGCRWSSTAILPPGRGELPFAS